jgi:hypothetical protein
LSLRRRSATAIEYGSSERRGNTAELSQNLKGR